MLTEVSPTLFAIKINGKIIQSNIQSRQLAEAIIFQLPTNQQILAEIVPMTVDGKTILFG